MQIWRNLCHSGGVDPRTARTRRAALEAARRVLREFGVDAVTHARVAQESGVGRRTLYRHWPDATALLHDVMAAQEVPHPEPTGDLRADLVAHLTALAAALELGGLAYVVCALGERAEHDPAFDALRRSLTDAGCRPAEDLLERASGDGRLPRDLDVPAAMGVLEGPIFYACLVRRRPLDAAQVDAIVGRFLADPPRRGAGTPVPNR